MVQTKHPPTGSPLQLPVTAVWGVGVERARQLERLGIRTIGDLLLHKPRRYEDRRTFLPISQLRINEPATVRGKVVASGKKNWKKGTRSLFECILEDGAARLHLRWWQAHDWMEDYYAVGREFLVFGKTESLRPRTFDHPETEPVEPGEDEFIHVNRIVPVHPLTEGLTARMMRGIVWRALEGIESAADETVNTPEQVEFESRLAADLRGDAIFPTRASALRLIHFPVEKPDVEIARRRLALEEFTGLQLQIQQRRRTFESKARALPCGGDQNRLVRPFLSRLGFKLTRAQTNVLREIRADMGGRHPMRRLLQGDVGSGKTAVAASAALMALESGFNAALMAPTEILAEQHWRNFSKWFSALGVRVELQTGSRKTSVNSASDGAGPVLFIGTHALITGGFELPKLGLVIIDEQHKFGVAQRELLLRKGVYPHLLVMTATPIPRTLGLTLYGDLDLSVIDEMPGGRGTVKTFIRSSDKLPSVWKFIREKIVEGRQAYVVYPRVEEQDTDRGLKAVTKEFENVARQLSPYRVGLLHGRMKPAEKETVMAAFRANEAKALLATSLIEVGVDVPNATVMLVENAEAFGLAQLHQLRGRIGRGAYESFCILISDAQKPESRERLRVLEETTDGFKIAEADLKLRGPGELVGQQQSGLPPFRFADLTEDIALIRQSKGIAMRILDGRKPV
jgi:ATP-dependent DNA helicase RecG